MSAFETILTLVMEISVAFGIVFAVDMILELRKKGVDAKNGI